MDLIAMYDVVRDATEDAWDAQVVSRNGVSVDLNAKNPQEIQGHQTMGAKCSSGLTSTRPQRVSVQAELRNLHSQWCSLLSGRSQGKGDSPKVHKPPASKRSRRALERDSFGKPRRTFEREPSDLTSESPESRASVSRRLQKKIKLDEAVIKQEFKKPNPEATSSKRKKKLIKKAIVEGHANSDNEDKIIAPLPRANGVHVTSETVGRQDDPPICTICDDGGDLICCEGPCQRHFHATHGTGDGTPCRTLGLTVEQVKKIDKYFCKNCLAKEHQCFICGDLGSSAPSSQRRQEVYLCDAPSCAKYYHPSCVAKKLAQGFDNNWTALAERIERGLHGFLCPRHSCAVCESAELQPGLFIQCRRCPKAWHRECLTDFKYSCELPTTLIWKHYDREFIYCKRHKVLPHIQTPEQNHVKFPEQ